MLKVKISKYSWNGEFSDLTFKIASGKGPEAHMLDTTGCKASSTTRKEGDIFDLEGERVEDLTIHDNDLGSPFDDHDYLKIVSS